MQTQPLPCAAIVPRRRECVKAPSRGDNVVLWSLRAKGSQVRSREGSIVGKRVGFAALVVIGLFLLATTKGVILGFPIPLIAVVLVLFGAYKLVRAFL